MVSGSLKPSMKRTSVLIWFKWLSLSRRLSQGYSDCPAACCAPAVVHAHGQASYHHFVAETIWHHLQQKPANGHKCAKAWVYIPSLIRSSWGKLDSKYFSVLSRRFHWFKYSCQVRHEEQSKWHSVQWKVMCSQRNIIWPPRFDATKRGNDGHAYNPADKRHCGPLRRYSKGFPNVPGQHQRCNMISTLLFYNDSRGNWNISLQYWLRVSGTLNIRWSFPEL